MSSTTMPFNVFDHIFADLYGVQLAGIFVSCVLYGFSCLQAFIYYMSKAKDPVWLKILPAWLIIIETIHQFLLCVAIYKVTINNFGNQNVINIIVPELFVSTMFQGVLTFSAHCFYIYRIWKFSKKMWIFPFICLPLTLTQLGLTLGDNALILIHKSLAYVATITWMSYSTHSINVFLDFVFVIAMIWLLNQERRSLFKKTNNMINRLVVLTINTGLATSIATLLTIVFLKASPTTLTYVFFNFLISPLYCNSVLANLNSREYIRGKRAALPNANTNTDFLNNGSSVLELGGLQFTPNGRTTRGSETQLDEPGSFSGSGFSGSTKAVAVISSKNLTSSTTGDEKAA